MSSLSYPLRNILKSKEKSTCEEDIYLIFARRQKGLWETVAVEYPLVDLVEHLWTVRPGETLQPDETQLEIALQVSI